MKTIKKILIFVALLLLAGQCFSVQRASARRSITLFPPTLAGEMNFEQLLENSHDIREFDSKPLSTNQIGQLAWAGSKIFGSGLVSKEAEFSNGSGLNLYFVTSDGVFEYDPKLHILKELTDVDVRDKISKASSDDGIIADCPCSIIVAVEIKKLARQSGLKTERFAAIQTGKVVQNIQTQAAAIGLGSTTINDFDITSVRMLGRLPSSVEPISIICTGYPAVVAGKEIQADDNKQATKKASAKQKSAFSAVFIVASKNFREEELFETQKQLENASIETVIASSKKRLIKGQFGGTTQARMLLGEIIVDDYDAVIFVGGVGAKEYFGDKTAWKIAREAVEKDKVLAAICIAPAILANAGVLDGVTATSFQSERARLKEAGARYTSGSVERDGLIITANGPETSARFGQVIAEAIKQP